MSILQQIKQSELIPKIGETFATRIVQMLLTTGATILVARVLGPDGRGAFALAATLSAVIIQIVNLGLHAANTYYSARSHGKYLNGLTGNAFLMSACLILPCLLLGLGFTIFPEKSPVSGWLLVLALASAPVGLLYMNLQNIIIGLREVRSINATEIKVNTLILAGLGLIALTGYCTPQSMYAVTLGSQAIGVILLFAWLSRIKSVFPKISLPLLRQSIHYGFKAWVATLFSFLVYRMDILMVNFFHGKAETGYYSIAVTLANMMYILPNIAGSLVFAKMCGLDTFKDRFKLGLNYSLGVTCIMTAAVIAAGLLSSFLIDLLFGKDFSAARDAFIFLLPGILAWSGENIIRRVLTSDGYHNGVVINWGIGFLINITLNLLLIPEYGIKGAAVASSASIILVALLNISIVIYEWKHRHE